MGYQNQITVKVEARNFNDGKLFARIHIDAMSAALKALTGGGYALWTYIASNQDNYQFDLSKQACVNFGFSASTYQRAKNELIDKGFLTPIREGSNIYIFHEYAAKGVQNEPGFKMNQQGVQNEPIWVQNEQRNTTIQHNTTINTTEAVSSVAEQEQEREEKELAGPTGAPPAADNLPLFHLLFHGANLKDLVDMGLAKQVEENIYEVTTKDGKKTLCRRK